MQFKIDKNLITVAAAKGNPDVAFVARELCDAFVDAGIIEDDAEHWGESVLIATGPQYVKDVCAVLARFLYDDESHSIPSDVFDAFCRLFIIGDGDCPHCGGELLFVETEGHELPDGDYYTPNSYIIDKYIYQCAECGEIIESEQEL